MANDLTSETTDTTRPQPRATGVTGVCSHCAIGDHHLCTGVGCYRCPREHHQRKPGVSGLGQVVPVTSGRQEGHAIAHKPAHQRGRG